MPRKAAAFSTFSYCIFRYFTDEEKELSVPVGVALWSPESRVLRVRFLTETERVPQLKKTTDYPFIKHVEDKIASWIKAKKLPHLVQPASEPTTDDWWRHVGKVLVHKVRASEPRPIDCKDAEAEIEPLFDSVVGPVRPDEDAKTGRIDGLLRTALGPLAGQLKRREVPGFGGREVQVQRALKGTRGWLIVEGVNFDADNSESEADAVTSKLRRVRAATNGQGTFIVGYVTPNAGLNGEAVLRDWIIRETHAKIFDLRREKEEFFLATRDAVVAVGGQEVLGLGF